MATKVTRMEQEAKELTAQQEEARKRYLVNEDAWDEADGQEFGGSAEVLILRQNEIAGPFIYTGHQQVQTDLGETTSHTGTDPDGEQVRLPIQATFLRAVDTAKLGYGDKFLVKRQPDQIKKKGKGAGNPMAIFAIKVIERSAKAGEATP